MRIRRFTALGAIMGMAGLIACAGDAAEDTTEDGNTTPPAATAIDTGATPAAGGDLQLPEGVTQAMVDGGKQAFETTICYTCHGMDASGTPLAPNLRDDVWLNTDGTMAGIEQVIREGVATPVEHPAPMPPMGGAQLTDEQIQNLSAYVYAISHGG